MFSLFRKEPELSLVFHIGSSSVGVALVKFERNKAPTVVYTIREYIPFRENSDPQKFFAHMLDALRRVNAAILKDGLPHLTFTRLGGLKIKHALYAFGSPWTVTQTKIVSIDKPEPFTFTKAMIDGILEHEETAFEKDAISGEVKDKLSVIEKRILQIKLNGYEVTDPYGKQTKSASMSLFLSIIPKTVLDKVFEISLQTFHPKDTRIYSFPLVSFSSVREAFPEADDFMFLYIGGELSDISFVKNGVLLETASLPLGSRFIIRRIGQAFSATDEEALSLLRLFANNHADRALKDKLDPALGRAIKEWIESFRALLKETSSRISIPSHLFVVTDNDFIQFFVKALKNEKISEFGVAETPLSVTFVNHDKLKQSIAFGKYAEKDPFLAIFSAFARKIYESEK